MAEFGQCLNFYCELDDDGSSTWFVDSRKVYINYYYNDKNIDLNLILKKLNISAVNLNLRDNGFSNLS